MKTSIKAELSESIYFAIARGGSENEFTSIQKSGAKNSLCWGKTLRGRKCRVRLKKFLFFSLVHNGVPQAIHHTPIPLLHRSKSSEIPLYSISCIDDFGRIWCTRWAKLTDVRDEKLRRFKNESRHPRDSLGEICRDGKVDCWRKALFATQSRLCCHLSIEKKQDQVVSEIPKRLQKTRNNISWTHVDFYGIFYTFRFSEIQNR